MGPRVTLRVDASETIGLGHLARCLALAGAVEGQGGRAGLVGRAYGPNRALAEVARDLLKEEPPFRFTELPDDLGQAEDARSTVVAAREQGSDLVMVDHYRLGAAWWRTVRGELPLAAVDDVGRPGLGDHADLVVNQNAGAREEWYAPAPRVLCGPRFVMLREEIVGRRRRWQDAAAGPRRVLVSMGGSDPAGATARVLRALRGVAGRLAVDVMLGAGTARREEVRREADRDPRIRLYGELSDLPEVLARADLAVVAGGSTVYECAYLGVPPVMIQAADNQAGVCRAVARAGAGVFVGELRRVSDEGLAGAVRDIIDDEDRARRMSLAGMQLVDGRGSRRVAEAMASIRDRG